MLEGLIKRDRVIILAGLVMVAALSWGYILTGAGMNAASPTPGSMKIMASGASWTPAYAIMMFVMWWVMMLAMMLPSAAPMILLFATVNKKAARQNTQVVPTFIFGGGYLLMWGGFSIAATFAQWALTASDLLHAMMQSNNPLLGGALLISAGLYQFTPVKDACLKHCQSPIRFIMGHWRPGGVGALKMGLQHGAYCLGCCWVLMGLLFFGGVMNIIWIGGLALYVLIEKLTAHGKMLGKLSGGALIVWGLSMIWG